MIATAPIEAQSAYRADIDGFRAIAVVAVVLIIFKSLYCPIGLQA